MAVMWEFGFGCGIFFFAIYDFGLAGGMNVQYILAASTCGNVVRHCIL